MRAWIEIEMDNLYYNIKKLQEKVPNNEIMAVVKANSYGFGSKEVTRYLSEKGIKKFAVACLEEALELRECRKTEEILILGLLLPEEIEQAAQNNIQITVGNWEQIKFIEDNRINIDFHIKIDTGMGRLGFDVDEGKEVVNYCLEKQLKIVGIYSHLSDADGFTKEADDYTKMQIQKLKEFENYKDRVKYIHILNSGGILRFNDEYSGNLVRAGICMYGMLGNFVVEGLKSVFTVKTKVLSLKTAKEEMCISYGRRGIIHKGETYATIGMGYADGVKKDFSNRGYVLVENEKCPIIGEVCMDMCMIKIPNDIVPKVRLGSDVIVLRDDIIQDLDIERKCSWDMLTGIGRRVHRVYKENNTPYLIK